MLYGGLGSLWRLPLQLSTLNDTLLTSYLAAHPLTARQNRTLAKPRPPTLPGFGEHPLNAQPQGWTMEVTGAARQGDRICC